MPTALEKDVRLTSGERNSNEEARSVRARLQSCRKYRNKGPELKPLQTIPSRILPSQEVDPVVDELGAAAGAEAAGAAAELSLFAASVLPSAGADSDEDSLLLAA
jgi:hypothetical protein